MPGRDEKGSQFHVVKACPYCRTYNKVDAELCVDKYCGKRIGEVDEHGKAQKPIDWQAHIISTLWWAGLAIYIWLLGWWKPFTGYAKMLAIWSRNVVLSVLKVVWDLLLASWDLLLASWDWLLGLWNWWLA